MIIGYAGGGTRNIIANKPVRNMAELKGLSMRVMGAPIQTQIFTAIGATPTVIAYNEVYNAIQTGVIQGARERGRRPRAMKFYEVGPDISLTQHAITVRPICFSGKTFRKLPPDLQAAILKAGKEAGSSAARSSPSEDAALLEQAGKGRQAQDSSCSRSAPKLLELRRAGEAGLCEGDRRDGDPQQGQRDQVATLAGSARRSMRQSAAPVLSLPRADSLDHRRTRCSRPLRSTALSTAPCAPCITLLIALLIVPVTLQIFSRFIDFIPRYIWTEEVGALLPHLDHHAGRDDRRARRHAFRRRRIAAPKTAARQGHRADRRPRRDVPGRADLHRVRLAVRAVRLGPGARR